MPPHFNRLHPRKLRFMNWTILYLVYPSAWHPVQKSSPGTNKIFLNSNNNMAGHTDPYFTSTSTTLQIRFQIPTKWCYWFWFWLNQTNAVTFSLHNSFSIEKISLSTLLVKKLRFCHCILDLTRVQFSWVKANYVDDACWARWVL